MRPWVLRIQPSGGRSGVSREIKFETKRELHSAMFMLRLGKTGMINKVAPRTYSVREAAKL